MKLLVGLGNYEDTYLKNRHNIGFWAVDELARTYKIMPFQKKFHGFFAKGKIEGIQVVLLKPETFMNDSGRSVQAAATFFKIKPEDIIVLHDELDLDVGKVKFKTGGGDAGHNGLRSITAALGKNYGRVRIGIGHPGDKDKVHSYVLSNFSSTETVQFKTLCANIARVMPLLLAGDDAKFLNDLALKQK